MNALRKLFGLVTMNEAGGDGGDGGGATPPATDAPSGEQPQITSLLGDAPAEPGAEGDPSKSEGEDKKPEAEKPANEAPETYEPFTFKEGLELDEKAMTEVQALFKELGLNQERAQGALDKLLQIQESLYGSPEEQAAERTQQLIKLNNEFAEQTRNLPGIGGANFDASLKVASRVIQSFGSQEFRDLLASSALGSHPEFFKFVHAIGLKMSPDSFVHGGDQPKGERRAADIMFGDLFNKA